MQTVIGSGNSQSMFKTRQWLHLSVAVVDESAGGPRSHLTLSVSLSTLQHSMSTGAVSLRESGLTYLRARHASQLSESSVSLPFANRGFAVAVINAEL
jgi:hypothetical protein